MSPTPAFGTFIESPHLPLRQRRPQHMPKQGLRFFSSGPEIVALITSGEPLPRRFANGSLGGYALGYLQMHRDRQIAYQKPDDRTDRFSLDEVIFVKTDLRHKAAENAASSEPLAGPRTKSPDGIIAREYLALLGRVLIEGCHEIGDGPLKARSSAGTLRVRVRRGRNVVTFHRNVQASGTRP